MLARYLIHSKNTNFCGRIPQLTRHQLFFTIKTTERMITGYAIRKVCPLVSMFSRSRFCVSTFENYFRTCE